jgi:quinol monooxygenase YgiN
LIIEHYSSKSGEIMAHQPLTIVACIKAKPGMEQQMQQDLLSLLVPTRAESGCITFDLLKDTTDPLAFVLYENWKDQVALHAHFQQPYVKQVLQAYEKTLAEPIVVMSLKQIG